MFIWGKVIRILEFFVLLLWLILCNAADLMRILASRWQQCSGFGSPGPLGPQHAFT